MKISIFFILVMLSDLVRIQAKHSSIIPEVAKSSESGLTSGLPPLVSDARANKFQRDYTGTESNRNSSKEIVPDGFSQRFRRDFEPRFVRRTRGRRSKACDMLIAIDEPLYVTYNRDLKNLTRMVKEYVKQLNMIYHRTVLTEKYSDIYFRVKEIRILYEFCTHCNQTQDDYLREFTKQDTSSFCLAHVFTFRDFPSGIQGLAWKSTICNARHNTGFTTFLNHQVTASKEDCVMTFAHEVGHNMGAMHDEDANCGSGYIMSESGSSKRSNADQEFSACSIRDIHTELDLVMRKRSRNCFRTRIERDFDDDFSICGDYKVEGDEECDCGMSYENCGDPCCYAAHISAEDLAWNRTAIPCRRHRSPICLQPFRSALTFGVIVPWSVIGTMIIALTVGLCWDWRHEKICFQHMTSPTSLIKVHKDDKRKCPTIASPTSPTGGEAALSNGGTRTSPRSPTTSHLNGGVTPSSPNGITVSFSPTRGLSPTTELRTSPNGGPSLNSPTVGFSHNQHVPPRPTSASVLPKRNTVTKPTAPPPPPPPSSQENRKSPTEELDGGIKPEIPPKPVAIVPPRPETIQSKEPLLSDKAGETVQKPDIAVKPSFPFFSGWTRAGSGKTGTSTAEPPVAPYHTRPDVSQVSLLKNRFEK